MAGAFAVLKGGIGFRLSEGDIISLLGNFYSDPSRSVAKDLWPMVAAGRSTDIRSVEALVREWRSDVLMPVISKIAGEPSRQSQRRMVLSQFVQCQEVICHRAFAIHVEEKYQAEFLASYYSNLCGTDETQFKIAFATQTVAMQGILCTALLHLAGRGFAIDGKMLNGHMDLLKHIHESILRFELTMMTLHVVAPETFDLDSSMASRAMASPVAQKMRAELNAVENAIIDETITAKIAEDCIARISKMKSDFMKEVFGIDMEQVPA